MPDVIPPASCAAPARDVPLVILGVAVIATALAMTAMAFRGSGTAINAFLFLDLGLSHPQAAWVERLVVVLMLAASVSGVVWRRWPLFLPAAIYLTAESVARWHVQGQAFSDWVLLSHSARYVTPCAAIVLILAARGSASAARRFETAGEWALRIPLAAVFAAHGTEAFVGNPGFVDLIISSAANLTGMRVTESAALTALEVIGCMDVAVAGVILTRPGRLVLGWAAGWASIAALSRITANGWSAYPDVLVRASYYFGPIALWSLLVRRAMHAKLPPPLARTPDRTGGG